jgi:hypothetical protein
VFGREECLFWMARVDLSVQVKVVKVRFCLMKLRAEAGRLVFMGSLRAAHDQRALAMT